MADPVPNSQTIWQALDGWAGGLRPWQRRILAYSTRGSRLDDGQITEIYGLFLEEIKLKEKGEGDDVPVAISGRPTEALAKPLRIDRVSELIGINALPEGAALEFGPGLTVIYGRNGAGKSGFARLFANACFSRHKPAIIGNIYDKGATRTASGKIAIWVDGASQDVLFTPGVEHAELRRISFFDTAVARHHVSQTAPFEFKPSGFDVFPEMARVYGALAARLDADVRARTRDTKFSDSFIGAETDISKAVASISASTDLSRIRALAVYGGTEKARFEEIDGQLVALRSRSPKEILAQLKQARADIGQLSAKLAAAGSAFTAEKAAQRTKLSGEAKTTAEAATALGAEQFRRPFFNAVGTAEWQAFAKAAHALAEKEGTQYPTAEDRCLLCERPFDTDSRKHVEALLSFVEGDLQRAAAAAQAAVEREIDDLVGFDLGLFNADSRVRDQVHRLDPVIEVSLADAVEVIKSACDKSVAALRARTSVEDAVDTTLPMKSLGELTARIDKDIARLEKDDPSQAITSLEVERQTLRHREVLSQLLPAIERQVADATWCTKAERAKSSLSPRHITEKEKELFGAIIGESYRSRLAYECRLLDCMLPVELQTAGQKGKTVRSLAMKGGYQPEIILSEGEQKAVALADFLTEVSLNPANAGIVLDDPVTSQDHQRKELFANRLVDEAKRRQVIVFTHDLPFLNQIISRAESEGVDVQKHWVERDKDGKPGHVALHDAPATSKDYDTADKAKAYLAQAQKLSGTERHTAICAGMGALRRTLEETVVKRLFKGIVPRWSDRVIVTALRRVAWEDRLVDDLVDEYEALSAYIEGHSHTDEATGAPPEIKDLEGKIAVVEGLIKRARTERAPTTPAKGNPVATNRA
jgi:hypothetical protein